MRYIGENAIKKLIALIKGDLNKKLDKNQGTTNSGKILGVNASGEVAPTDTEVATLVDVPNGIVKGDGTTISAAVAGTDYAVASHNHDNTYLKLNGGTLTGNLSGKYITGTWLQTTASTALGSAATKICVLDGSGWVYYRTPEQIRSDIGAAAVSHVSDANVHITGDYTEAELQTIWDSAKVITLVTFSIGDILDLGYPTGSFTAEEGMTLTEWLASSYNTNNIQAEYEDSQYGTVYLNGSDTSGIKEGSYFEWSI